MNILISVSGSGVSVAQENNGQLSGLPFIHENVPGNTLRKLLQKYSSAEHTIVIADHEFGTGYHVAQCAHGAGGVCFTYRLRQIMTHDENVAAHDALVFNRGKGKCGLRIAFERAAAG